MTVNAIYKGKPVCYRTCTLCYVLSVQGHVSDTTEKRKGLFPTAFLLFIFLNAGTESMTIKLESKQQMSLTLLVRLKREFYYKAHSTLPGFLCL